MPLADNLLLANYTTWVLPVWLICSGATLGLLILAAAWGVQWLVARDAARQVPDILQGAYPLSAAYPPRVCAGPLSYGLDRCAGLVWLKWARLNGRDRVPSISAA